MDRIDQWELFVAVASRGSFAAAARALGRSPQVMTRAVASLEARLETRLLHRTTRSVSLTPEGADYLARARELLADFHALDARARGALAGVVTIAAPVLFGQLHVAPILHAMIEDEPGVDLRLLLHDRVVSLSEEGIDLAVRLGPLPDSALRARPLGAVRSLLCASPRYLKRRGVPRAVRDLAGHEVIAFSGTTPIADRWSLSKLGRRVESVAVRPRLVVNTAQAAIDAALAGLGIVRLLSYQVEALVAERRLRVVLAEHESAPVPIHLLQLPGVPSRAATALADRLIAGLAAKPAS